MGRQARARRKAQKAGAKSSPAVQSSKQAKVPTPAGKKKSKTKSQAKGHVISNSRLIKGFRILELYSESSWNSLPRLIYVKRHFSNDEENADRTVFVTGLPIDIPVSDLEQALEKAFAASFGPVQHAKVTLLKDHEGRATVRCGHVVFEEEDGVEAALSEAEFGIRDPTPRVPVTGLQKYLQEAKSGRPTLRELRKANEEALAAVDAKEAEIKAAKAKKNMVDADGFTLVTGKRKVSRAAAQARSNGIREPILLVPRSPTFRFCMHSLTAHGRKKSSKGPTEAGKHGQLLLIPAA